MEKESGLELFIFLYTNKKAKNLKQEWMNLFVVEKILMRHLIKS